MHHLFRKVMLAVALLGFGTNLAEAQQSDAGRLSAPLPWRDSLSVLNKLIANSPRSTDLRLKKAAVNIELGQWDYAIDEYGRVLDLDPQSLAALFFRAYAHTHEHHYDLACRDYEQFLMLAPRHFEARLGLAMVKEQMGRKQDALDQLNLLVEQHPDSALAWAARANNEAAQQHHEAALYDWDQAIALKPLNADYVAAKTELLLALHRNDEAWALIEEALRRGIPRSLLKPWIDRCH